VECQNNLFLAANEPSEVQKTYRNSETYFGYAESQNQEIIIIFIPYYLIQAFRESIFRFINKNWTHLFNELRSDCPSGRDKLIAVFGSIKTYR
jgi:hypothetical protein